MMYLELTKIDKGKEFPVQVNPGAILFYEPYDDHCRLWLYYGQDSFELDVKETYSEVNEIIRGFERDNEADTLALHVGVQQYLDFFHSTKPSMLRDEYLKWKGRHEFLSKKRWIDADELLLHISCNPLTSREKLVNIITSLIEKDKEEPNENHMPTQVLRLPGMRGLRHHLAGDRS